MVHSIVAAVIAMSASANAGTGRPARMAELNERSYESGGARFDGAQPRSRLAQPVEEAEPLPPAAALTTFRIEPRPFLLARSEPAFSSRTSETPAPRPSRWSRLKRSVARFFREDARGFVRSAVIVAAICAGPAALLIGPVTGNGSLILAGGLLTAATWLFLRGFVNMLS